MRPSFLESRPRADQTQPKSPPRARELEDDENSSLFVRVLLGHSTARRYDRHRLPEGARVVATPILGGLHHEYRLETAA